MLGLICFIRKRLPAIRDYIANLVGFVVMSSIFLLLTIFIGISVLLPGTMFKLPVLLGLLSAPFIAAYVLVSIKRRKSDTSARKPKTHLDSHRGGE